MRRTKKPNSAAYRLAVNAVHSERTGKPGTLLTLETAQVFAAFAYELSVTEERAPGRLALTVLGLRAPHLGLPRSGPARWSREYDDLAGDIAVTVRGIDGTVHSCAVHVAPGIVRVVALPEHDPAFELTASAHTPQGT